MNRYYSPVSLTATATGNVTGYPPSNVEDSSIAKPWRTTPSGTPGQLEGDTLTLTFATAQPVCVFVIGTNASSIEIHGSAGPGTPKQRATRQYPDGVRHRMFRAGIGFQSGGTTIELKPMDTILDGESYFEIGAVHIMTATVVVKTPIYGFNTEFVQPRVVHTLANGRPVPFNTGSRHAIIRGTVLPKDAEDFEQTFRDTGTQILEMWEDTSGDREDYVWPVQWAEDSHSREIANVAVDRVPFTFHRVD